MAFIIFKDRLQSVSNWGHIWIRRLNQRFKNWFYS